MSVFVKIFHIYVYLYIENDDSNVYIFSFTSKYKTYFKDEILVFAISFFI